MSKNIDSTNQIHARTGTITPASGATVLAAYDDRRCVIIQNLGTNTLYVKFGEAATTASYDVILKAGSANDDALGGIISYDVLSYTGPISVAGTTPRLTATDF
jgi:hypothetical protein